MTQPARRTRIGDTYELSGKEVVVSNVVRSQNGGFFRFVCVPLHEWIDRTFWMPNANPGTLDRYLAEVAHAEASGRVTIIRAEHNITPSGFLSAGLPSGWRSWMNREFRVGRNHQTSLGSSVSVDGHILLSDGKCPCVYMAFSGTNKDLVFKGIAPVDDFVLALQCCNPSLVCLGSYVTDFWVERRTKPRFPAENDYFSDMKPDGSCSLAGKVRPHPPYSTSYARSSCHAN
ncbi:MAG: hypothetical protein PHD48_01115 [Alphaproteobacteria bacterium]|nr:hypothetical protein [Alphaproteobacteria bacterium]